MDIEQGVGFVVITFSNNDETCPLGHCPISVVAFDHFRDAAAYARTLDPADHPHVESLRKVVTVEDE